MRGDPATDGYLDYTFTGWAKKSYPNGAPQIRVPFRVCPKCYHAFYSTGDWVRQTFPAVPPEEIHTVVGRKNTRKLNPDEIVQTSIVLQCRRHDHCTGVMFDVGTVVEGPALPTPEEMDKEFARAAVRKEAETVAAIEQKQLMRQSGLRIVEPEEEE